MLNQFIYTKRKLKIMILLGLAAGSTLFSYDSVSAQVASASGSSTLTINPTITTTITNGVIQTISSGGYTSSVSGETVLPQGYFFSGSVTVSPTYGTTAGVGNVVQTLTINPGTLTVVSPNSTFNRAAAETLLNAANGSASIKNNIDSVAAVIKAGAGINGLD
ncbi:hypothetical protein Syn7502_00822 [Synechococcus sp. PCC 7502]|uniref:hypothetical protein n=1 Tax=Synechococcus sp. PCC 7502 TaxID=1173263 RepID=UPI00029FEADD|nr:hypothetical protein [Synechococcus sp. PCC 7502]AFY72954.1 hypothetical protein Syn7502_00822 [Synechococcus sp. PCC 7502]